MVRFSPTLLALLLLLPLVPVGPAQSRSDDHYLNLNQPIALPGAAVSFSVSGPAGELGLRAFRVSDPARVRDFGDVDEALLERVLERTLRIATESWRGDGWGHLGDRLTFERPGLYLVETERGEATRRAWLQVTTHSYVVKQGPENGLLYAYRLSDGAPLASAQVLLNGTSLGATDAQGMLRLDPARLDGPLLVLHEGVAAAGEMRPYRSSWFAEPERVVIQLDRPIYRPGHTVHLKAVAFRLDGDRFEPFNATALRVKVTTWARGSEQVVHTETLQPNDHGSVALSFRLGEEAPLGHYSIQVEGPGALRGWSGFQVEAYKKPRIKVDVETAKDAYVAGEPVVVRAQAQWFFGSPLNRGEVTYRVAPAYGYGWGCPYCGVPYLVDRSVPFPEHSGSGRLAEDGTFSFTFTPDAPLHPSELEVSVAVTSESGERQEGEARFTLHPAALVVESSIDGWAYEKGEDIRAAAMVTDLSGVPVPGRTVLFILQQPYADGRGVTVEAVTDAAGRAQAALAAPVLGGGYTLTARVKDDAGRWAASDRWLYVLDERGAWYGAGERVTLVPERASYAPGETARVLLLASEPMHVLVTVEGRELHDARVVRVEGGTLVELPVGDGYAPGVTVVATAFRMDKDAQYGPEVTTREAPLEVRPDPSVLNVTVIPEKPGLRDGDEQRLLVQVRDADGRPVSGEIALGVVDESIHRLVSSSESSFPDRLYSRAYGVQTVHPWWTLRTMADVRGFTESALTARATAFDFAGAEASTLGVADSYKSFEQAALDVREDFPDTALWLPFLRTDANGAARVRLTAPDTLTEWRVSGFVHTLEGLVGEGRGSFHTRKPLMVELAAPRFLVQGDSLNVTAVVFNHMGEMRDIDVQLVGEGAARLTGSAYRRVTLSDGDSVRIDFPILATDDLSALANLTVLVVGGDESDAMRLRLPVLPHGVLHKATRAGVDDARFTLPAPAGPHAAPPTLTVQLNGGMAGAVLDALPNLLGFPYGCVEQTMSRFMPAVVATRALVDAGYDAKDPRVPEYVQKGLERLMRFQHQDGGWGWWESDATHPYMTAYVVAGLSEAKRAGVVVDEERFRRGVVALGALYNSTAEGDMRAYHAYALALAGAPPTSWPAEDTLSVDGLALLGLARLHAGDRAGAERILDRLLEQAVRGEARLHWESGGERWGSHGIRSDVQLTAHVLRLMMGVERDEEAPSVVAWLAQQRRGSWWSTTKDTSESVLAIVDYLRASDELRPDFDALVTVGDETFRVPFHGGGKDASRRAVNVTLAPDQWGTDVRVSVAREGSGRLYWSAVLAATPRAESIPPESRGVRVEKRILDERGAEVSHLRFNEEYVVRVEVTPDDPMEFVLLRDPLPAGVEVVRTGKPDHFHHGAPFVDALLCWDCGGWHWPWSNVEVRDDHVAAFASLLPEQTTTISYRIRAVQPGSYHLLPASVEEMYDPLVWGRSGDAHVRVGDVPGFLLGDALVTDLAVRLRVFPQGAGAPEAGSVEVELKDAAGAALPLLREPEVVPLEDGSLNVSLATEVPLPQVFTVALRAPGIAPVVRTFDRASAPVALDGAFPEPLRAAWESGQAVDATTSVVRSAPADPSLIVREEPPRPVEPTGDDGRTRDVGVEAPRQDTPGAGLLATVAAAALVATALRRRGGR